MKLSPLACKSPSTQGPKIAGHFVTSSFQEDQQATPLCIVGIKRGRPYPLSVLLTNQRHWHASLLPSHYLTM